MKLSAWCCPVCGDELTCTENGWLCAKPGVHTKLIPDRILAQRLHEESILKYKDRCDSYARCEGIVKERRRKLLPTEDDLLLERINNMEQWDEIDD